MDRMSDERLAALKRNAEIVASRKYKGWFNEVVLALEAERERVKELEAKIAELEELLKAKINILYTNTIALGHREERNLFRRELEAKIEDARILLLEAQFYIDKFLTETEQGDE